MKKLITSLLLLISASIYSQTTGVGLSMDFTGGFDFQETNLYRLKHQSNGGLSSNINIGLFVRKFIDKYIITLGGNVGMLNSLYDGMEYTTSYCDVDIAGGQYESGVKSKSYSNMLYGSYNPYYSKSSTTEYEANSYVSQRNVYIIATYAISESINIGTGLNIGFRKEVITVLETTSISESFYVGDYYHDSYSLPLDRIEINTINLKAPIIAEWHIKNAIAIYLSANIGNDYTTTIGVKWDIAKILSNGL
jgi:hypothetical protein